MRENFIVSTTGNNDPMLTEGLRWLVTTAAKTSRQGLIAVNAFPVMERVVRRVFDEASAKQLRAGTVTVNGVLLLTMSEHKPLYDFDGPVFALYPSKKLLDRLDDMHSVTHLLVLPWLEKDVQDWVRAWTPGEFGAETSPAGGATIGDPVVRAAMDDLVSMINVGTGIVHPSDKEMAIQIFRCLELNGVQYDPDEIRAWLVAAHGMESADADDVRELARKILEGRTVQGGGPARKNVKWFKMWVAEANENGNTQ